MPPNVFISHSSKDKEVANHVCQHLEAHGHRCWIAPRDVPPGSRYGASIVHAISEALAVVLIFSEHSDASEQVKNEIERAVDKKKEIYPIKIQSIQPSAEMEFFMSRRHWLDTARMSFPQILQELTTSLDHLRHNISDLPQPVTALPETSRPTVRKKRQRAVGITTITLGLCAGLTFTALHWYRLPSAEHSPSLWEGYLLRESAATPPTDRQSEIDRLVQELLQTHRTRPVLEDTAAVWASRPLVLAFLRGSFAPASAADEALLSGMEQALRATGRFTVVERDLLDKLLGELKLSATDLVDRQTALRVGKILGAGLLAAGSIRRQGTTGALTVRLLHTETTEIVAAGSAFFDDATAPPEQVTAPLAAQLLEALRSDRKKRYLLQGEILRTTPTVLLNIGAAQGMVPGLHLEIVEALEIDGTTEYITRDDLGQLIVTDVQVRSSQAKSASSSTSLHKGWKVREVYTP